MTRRRRQRARRQKERFLPIGFQHATVLRRITNKNKQKGGGREKRILDKIDFIGPLLRTIAKVVPKKKRDIKELDLSSFISEEA